MLLISLIESLRFIQDLNLSSDKLDNCGYRQDVYKNANLIPIMSKKTMKPIYSPNDNETFMNDSQVEYFKAKLLDWKNSILEESKGTIEGMQQDTRNIPDSADRASEETDRALELRTRDRQRKLITKIDAAIRRIADGSYGYCEETGEPISIKRLDARPIATLSLEAQERHERKERVHREE